jgi:RHS repeat-associated protein
MLTMTSHVTSCADFRDIRRSRRVALHIGGITTALLLATTGVLAAAGWTPGTFAVSPAGAATYTIPIWSPPGPHGLQPHISLTYNSSQGNGYAGMGWSLSGLSSISRCNQTYAQEGAPAAVTLTGSDVFCLDGQRLRLTAGAYGQAGSTYQTEIANFSVVTANGTAGNGPASFVVQDRNGLTYTYGNGGNSQVVADGSTTALMWLLDEVSDPAGNTMTISYTPGTGSAVPHIISWTPTSYGSSTYAYTMTFTYGANEVPVNGFVSGTVVNNSSLLGSIAVAYSGTTVKRYVLTYTAAPTTSRDRLYALEECSDDTTQNCLSPTYFTYQPGVAGVGSAVTLTNSQALGLGQTTLFSAYDLNGDGLNDLAWYENGSWWVAFATSTGYSTPQNTGITASPGVVEDIDGSGQDSFLVPVSGVWWTYKWNGSSFAGSSTNIAVDQTAAGSFAVADINGDGLPDLITTRSDGYLYVRLNTTSSGAVSFASTALKTIQNTFNQGLLSSYGGTRRFDFYGAGQQDLLGRFNVRQQIFVGVLHFNGTTFVTTNLGPRDIVDIADFNDDGCTDFLGSNGLTLSPCAGGTGTFVSIPAGFPVAAMDWDGDGRRDLIVNYNNTLLVYLANGTGFNSTSITTSISALGVTFKAVHNPAGDGQDGLIAFSGTSPYTVQYYLHNGAGLPPDLLSNVTDGNGNSVSLTYTTLARSVNGNFFPRSDAAYPYQNYIGPLYVVNLATASDPSGQASTYQMQHFYGGAWMNLQGRGLGGFEAHQTLDSRNGVYETRQYDLAFPYTGMLVGDVKTENNTPATTISSVSNTPACTALPSGACPSQNGTFHGRYFPYVSNTTAQEYELGTTANSPTRLVSTASTGYSYDSYGNPLTVTTTVTDNDTNDSSYLNKTWTVTRTNTPNTGTGVGCTSLLMQTQVTYTSNVDGPVVTRTKSFTPDLANCHYTQIVTEPGNATYQVTESLDYDRFGNVDSDTITGAGMSPRQTFLNWTSSAATTGQFVMSRTDAAGATTQFDYNFNFGLPGSMTDPNYQKTSWVYDSFGRLFQETRPDGTNTQWSYADCPSIGCVVGVHGLVASWVAYNSDHTELTDGFTVSDPIGRFLWSRNRLVDSQLTYARQELRYDSLGRVHQQAAPCIYSAAVTPCPYMTTTAFDVKNRPTSVTRPISASNHAVETTSISYQGDTTVTTDAQNKLTTQLITPAGRLVRTQDDSGYYINFGHDAYGSLTSSTDKTGLILASSRYDYGLAPYKRTLADADLGSRTYTYDALGELTSWGDANGNTASETYDPLSRPLTRTEQDLTTNWTWGNAPTNRNVGKLASVTANGFGDAYTYDSYARLLNRTITIPSDGGYSYDYSYSPTTGLLDTLTYPTSTSSYRLKLQYTYLNGVLQKISDFNAPSTVFWTANSSNARGQVTQETLGNGVVVMRTIDDVTGLIGSIQAGVGGGAALQNQSYLFDYVGNLIQRQDNNRGLTENLQYDDLYRLKQSTLNGVTNLSNTYDAMGNNLTSQTEGGAAATLDFQTPQTGCAYYANSQPHAVRSIGNSSGTISNCYDKNGNGIAQLSSGVPVANSTWTSYNQPYLMSEYDGTSSQFSYDGNHQRWQQVATYSDGFTETTTYIGRQLEKLSSSYDTEYRHYIPLPGGDTVLYTRVLGGAASTYYITADHLGSSSVTTNSSGALVVAENFAALGYRRGASWTGGPTDADWAAIDTTTRHGFNGQEMLDNLAMVNMNGRMYGETGQFLSPDPFVQDLTNTQNFNRYAYALNNPLSYRDPTGYCWEMLDNGGDPDLPGFQVIPCPVPPPMPSWWLQPGSPTFGLPGTPGGNPGTSPHLVNVPPPQVPNVPVDTSTRINIAACMAGAGAENSEGETGAAQSLEPPGNGATAGAAASDQAAEAANSAAESTARVGRPLAGTQTILDPALFPGVAQIPNVYAYRSLLNARSLAFSVGAKGLGFMGTAIDAGLAVNDLANGRDFEASLNFVSAGMGTAMLVQPEVTPVALPIAFIAKGPRKNNVAVAGDMYHFGECFRRC